MPKKPFREFNIGDRVLARCSEGSVYRGLVYDLVPNSELICIHFEDDDKCQVRRRDVRHQYHVNEIGSISFPTIKEPPANSTSSINSDSAYSSNSSSTSPVPSLTNLKIKIRKLSEKCVACGVKCTDIVKPPQFLTGAEYSTLTGSIS